VGETITIAGNLDTLLETVETGERLAKKREWNMAEIKDNQVI